MKNYILPPLDLLQQPDTTSTATEAELLASAQIIQQTLAQFGIGVTIGDITNGPTLTRYEFFPAPSVLLERIPEYANNLCAALKTERIYILTPVPGKSTVGIEIPNRIRKKVAIRDVLESEPWLKIQSRIPLALGRDIFGQPLIGDLGDMPHLLIGGLQDAGKSVCLHSIIASLLYRFSPDQLRFLLIEPMSIELQSYNNLPHLVAPVVRKPGRALLALRWVLKEIEKRYKMFARVGTRNINAFNSRPKREPTAFEREMLSGAMNKDIKRGTDGLLVEIDEELLNPFVDDITIPERLSYLVVIINGLDGLMVADAVNFEIAISNITAMARAAGVHCIVITQQPSIDVVTGRIKSNIPARIAFQVASQVDSRTILNANDAHKLLGKGDMLYLPPGSAKLIRAQGAFISDQEIQSVVAFIEEQGNQFSQL